MNSKHISLGILAILWPAAICFAGSGRLHIVTTGDVHGSYFGLRYEDDRQQTGLMSVKAYVDSLRTAEGAGNVLLLDAGDFLQGDNAAYYYNYVETEKPHIFPRVAACLGYDAVVLGNHDIETGHPVYDRVAAELNACGIPVLAGNLVSTVTGKPAFPVYTMVRKSGLDIAVLGFDNANIRSWLSEELFSGMDILSLVPFVQTCVDEVIAAEKPDLVVVATHTGTGDGDGSILESQGMDLLNTLHGVDVIVCAHDHRPAVVSRDGAVLVNGGSRAGYVTHTVVDFRKSFGRVRWKSLSASVVRLDKKKIDSGALASFREDYEAVKAFTNRKVGMLDDPLSSRDAYAGMSAYINLLHTVQLGASDADVSFAAPLSFNGYVKAGVVRYGDLSTIYPFENQLYVLRMSGEEIRNYLEFSYDKWIQTPGEHVLRIVEAPDARTGSSRWSFVNRAYNFDSAGGLVYSVDVTRPFGSRVSITSFADGRAFDPAAVYNVAMTSYRANGGGSILTDGAGVPREESGTRIVARYPEIRELVYRYISSRDSVSAAMLDDKALVGSWRFVPEETAGPMIEADLGLIF